MAAFALLASSLLAQPAFAGPIANTVTVTGSSVGQTVTATSSINVTVAPPEPQLSLEKIATVHGSGPQGSVVPGDLITYTFTVTNTGNVTLAHIKLEDLDAQLQGTEIATLAPGLNNADTTTFTAKHVLTATDISKVVYTNIANATATAVTGGTVTATAQAKSLLNVSASLDFAKTAALNPASTSRPVAGDVVTYTFTVTNTGNSDLHNVVVNDPMLNLAMLPGQERTIALLTGANTPSDNFAVASIIPDPTDPANFKTDVEDLQTAPSSVPQLVSELRATRQLVNMSGSQTLQAGDRIGFVYTLYNSGEAPLTAIDVQQPDATAFGSKLDMLPPGQADSASVIYTREVTPEEIASGTVLSPATIVAKSRGQTYRWGVADALAVSAIRAYDSFTTASITPSSLPVLHAQESTTFTATYKLAQSDIDNGSLHNTASVSALDLTDKTLTKTAFADVTLPRLPGVAMVKTGIVDLGADNVASLGDVVTYEFAVKNTGNVTLSNVTVTDTDLPGLALAGAPIATLAPGQTNSTAYTATYQLVQADLDAGKVTNHASVTATAPVGAPPLAPRKSDRQDFINQNPTDVSLAPAPKIALLKTVSKVNDVNNNGMTDKDDTIEYAFAVKNIGNQTLNNIDVTDGLTPVLKGGSASGNALSGLAPGKTNDTYFTAVYTITQVDVDAGHVDNTAHVVGYSPANTLVVDDSDPAVQTQEANAPTVEQIPAKPVVTLVKTQDHFDDVNHNGVIDTNDVIWYSFKVANAGNVTLHSVSVSDNLPAATMRGNVIATLLPGQSDTTTYTASYTVTAQDMLSGQVSNQATAHGFSPAPANTDVSDLSDNIDPTKNSPTITPLVAKPDIAVIKTVTGVVDSNNNNVTDAGDTINYAFAVKNTGNVTLTDIRLVEKLIGAVITGGPSIATLNAGSIDDTTFKASYVLTTSDVTLGSVTNQAEVSAQPATGSRIKSLSDNNSYVEHDPTITYLSDSPRIGLLTVFDHFEDGNGVPVTNPTPGDFIVYAITVMNTGNVPLMNVVITDPAATVYANGTPNGTLPTLPTGATDGSTFKARYKILPDDVSNGGVAQQTTAYGYTARQGQQVTDLSDPFSALNDGKTFVPLSAAPGIALIKTAQSVTDVNDDGHYDEGDVINYAFTVTNSGNVDLYNVTVADLNPGAQMPAGQTIATLPVGASNTTTFTASYAITAADGDNGSVSNQARATAFYKAGDPTSSINDLSDFAAATSDRPTVIKVEKIVPSLSKTAAKSTIKRGEQNTFTITATNLTNGAFEIDDLMPQYFSYIAGSATVNGAAPATAPTITGNKISFTNLTPTKGKVTVKLALLSSAAIDSGKYTNNAQVIKSSSGAVIAKAQAIVTIADEAVFDCSDIIGRVFDDKNMNGYYDDGEPGLPAVRLATLNGTLITTDANGLYHVPCAAIPDPKIGSNYVLKLDTRTLPIGYKLTTENPRDVRVTRGKVTKLNFGAGKDHDVQVELNAKAFDGNSTELSNAWQESVDNLIAILQKQHSALKLVYVRSGETDALAMARVKAVQQLISDIWVANGGSYQLAISGSVQVAK